MHKINVAAILLVFCVSGWSQSENSWTKKSSFGGLKREKAVAFSINDFGYISTGVDTAEDVHNDLWQYDPTLDTWTQKASIPAPERRNAIAFAIEGKGYVGTGFDNDDGDLGQKLKDFWEYDPIGNSWSEKAHYPGGGDTGVYQATAFAILNKGYIACGKIGSNAYLNELWEYNPESDEWTERTPFPGGPRYQLVSFALENRAYVGMGTDNDIFRKDFYEYDPNTNTWESSPDLPGTERAKASTFSIGIRGYVVFGSDGGLKDELWEYNYYTESWTNRAPFPGGGRQSGIAFSIGNKGYAGIGKESSGKRQSFYEYTPAGFASLNKVELLDFKLYPNPILTSAQIDLPEKLNSGTYTVQSVNGQLLRKGTFSNNKFSIDRDQLENGYYQLNIFDKNGYWVGTKKIILL